jgi:hypothetical protein
MGRGSGRVGICWVTLFSFFQLPRPYGCPRSWLQVELLEGEGFAVVLSGGVFP